MYNDAEDAIFDIDIFEYAKKDKQSDHDNQKKLREVFKPVAFQQQKRRSLPKIAEPPKQNSCGACGVFASWAVDYPGKA